MSGPSSSRAATEQAQGDQPAGGGSEQAMGTMAVLGPSAGLRPATTVVFERQRTFRHYLTYSDHKGWTFEDITQTWKSLYGEKGYFNRDWRYLPYQWLCSYMSPREYQAMNVEFKRWRVLTFGVNAHHIVPFVDDLRSVSGNVTPSVEISPLNFFETFLDTEGELPHMQVVAADLPNDEMRLAYTARSNSELKAAEMLYNGYEGGEQEHFLSLEQSPGYSFVYADGGFSYTHDVHPVDQQWRHALFPINQNYNQYKADYAQNDGYLAPILGRVNNNSGAGFARSGAPFRNQGWIPQDNLLYESWTAHYPHSPPPKLLLRVPEIQRASDVGCPYGFVLYVTYKMRIEAEPNYVAQHPIKFSQPTSGKLFYGERESFQPTGGDCHKMILFGNKDGGNVRIDKSHADIN